LTFVRGGDTKLPYLLLGGLDVNLPY